MAKQQVAAIPRDWRRVVELPKQIFAWPTWTNPQPPRPATGLQKLRSDLITSSTEICESIVLLADEGQASLEGFRVRLISWAYHRNRDVTATLEAPGGREFTTIARVDAWPSSPHLNSWKAMQKPGLAHLEALIDGCHIHRFNDNVKYGREAFGGGPEGNLPVAVPAVETLNSYRDFLRLVGSEFGISGFEQLESPSTWSGLI